MGQAPATTLSGGAKFWYTERHKGDAVRRIGPALVGLVLLADAAWAGGSGPVIIVRPPTVIVTPPIVPPQVGPRRPIIQHPRFVRPIVGFPPARLDPLPQPPWVPGSWQWVDNRQVWVPSHWETPGQLLILKNPQTE